MDRRKFLTAGALGAASMAAACDCAEMCAPDAGGVSGIAQRELKMVTTWPKDFPGLGAMAERTADMITRMSGGALSVKLFAAGELVGAFEAFDAVSDGAADLYHGAEYYWVGKSKAYPFFTSVPFGMTAVEHLAWINYGGGQELWDELSARFNIKPLASGNTSLQMGGWFRREINTLEDLKGLKIRMPGLGGDVLRRLGAAAVALPGGEIYQALQSGAIDGTEWVGPWNDLAFGFYREAPYYYWPGFHEPGAMLAVGVNKDVWDSFGDMEQSIIRCASAYATERSLGEFAHFNAVALETLLEEHGVQLRRFSDEIYAAFGAASKEVLEDAAASSDIAGRVFDSFRTSLLRSQNWFRVAEEAYMAARRTAFSI